MKPLIILILIAIAYGNLTSCKDSTHEHEAKISKLEDEISELKKRKVDTSIITEDKPAGKFVSAPDPAIQSDKYVFAEITVESSVPVSVLEGPKYEVYTFTNVTDIHEIKEYTEEKKVRFRDQVRSEARFHRYMNPKIKAINIKTYSSYTEASEAIESKNYDGYITLRL